MSPSLPSSFKGAHFASKGADFSIKDFELKQPGPGQVVVKVIACGVCHSDAAAQSGAMGDIFPRIPGHEIVGDVVAVGSNVTKFKGGERVGGAWHGGHDNSCRQCQRGQFQMCETQTINGITQDGGYAEYVTLREEAVVRVPSELDPAETAPLLCAGVTVFNGIRKMHIEQGEVVAVQGLGGLGHLAIQYASKMGYRTVAISSSDSKKDFATKLGAHDYIDTSKEKASDALQKLGGAALIVATAPHPDSISSLVYGLGAGGKLLVLAPVGPISVDTVPMIMKGASVHGWPSGHALDSEEAIDFSARHGIKCMIEKFPLSDVQKAYDHMMSGKVRFRSVITI